MKVVFWCVNRSCADHLRDLAANEQIFVLVLVKR